MTKIFQVGGSVRDKILGVDSKDIDFVVIAPSFAAMRDMIIARGGKIFLETEKFLTIRANVPQLGSADYVLARKDGTYSDGRRPDEVIIGSLEDDLARRDFTINAIAIDTETGEMIDPHGGQIDIAGRFLRCVGNPIKRFNEDKLRIFRALRFSICKNFLITRETENAIRYIVNCPDITGTDGFENVSTERIRDELLKMFSANWRESFHLLENFELMNLIDKRGIWLKPTTEHK